MNIITHNKKTAAGSALAFLIAALVFSLAFSSAYAKGNDDKGKKDDRHEDKKEKQCPPGFFKHFDRFERFFGSKFHFGKGWINHYEKCGGVVQPGTTTPPTSDGIPRITSIDVSQRATSTVTISWKTNEATRGSVRYSTNENVATSTSATVADDTLATIHSIKLTGLTPNTTYRYVIVAYDQDGHLRESAIKSFKTTELSVTDDVAPKIVYVANVGITATSSRVIWITDEPSDSKVWISTSSSVDASGTPTVQSASSVSYHDLKLENLATSTTYYYTVSSTDKAGNKTILTGNFFQTLAQ